MRQYDLSVWVMPHTGKKHNSVEIEEFIIDRIQNRVVQAFERIPSHRTLARLNKVNRNTALRAYTKLIAMGWLTHSKGSMACVADPLPSDRLSRKPLSMPETLPSVLSVSKQTDSYSITQKESGFISVGISAIDKAYWPVKLLSKYSRESSIPIPPGPGMPDTATSTPSLQTAVMQQLNLRGFNIRADHLMVIRGRSESIKLLLKAIAVPGDLMINTSPLDMLVNSAMLECGIRVTALDMSGEGFLQRLQDLISKSQITAVYVRPGAAYPNCRNLDEASCQKLVELAKQHQFYILEEDDDHEFWWGGFPLKPLAHYNHDGFVIYCGALSRVSPYLQHLRTLVAPSQLIDALKGKAENYFGYRDFSQEKAIIRLLTGSELLPFSRQARLAKLKDLKNLNEILQLQLGEYISYDLPECGTAIWISFPPKTDLTAAFEVLKNEGHQIRSCLVRSRSDQPVHHIRLDFGRFDPRECRQAAIKLRSLLKKKRK